MDVFNFCWMTLLDESKKCCVFFDKNTCNVKNDVYENFNKPVNRISYLYKFGSYNISFFHQCFMQFYTKVSDSSKIIDNFRSLKNLTVCSMSAGPGTDIIGLLYSLFLINKPLINSAVFKVVSRQGSWRNLVNEMVNSSIIHVPEASTCKLIECDFLKDLSKKAQGYLKAADILLMCNSFSSETSQKVINHTLKMVIQLLKSGALVFFIISNDKSAFLKELNTSGTFLYGPAKVTLENMPYNEKIAELVSVKPLCSGSSMFAVWQKSHEIKPEMSKKEKSLAVGNNPHSSTNLNDSKRDVKNNNSTIPNVSSLKREYSSDSLGNSSQFSLSSISSQVIKSGNTIVSDNSINSIQQNKDFSETNTIISTKNTSGASLNNSNPLVDKKNTSTCESGFKNKGNDMNSLLKNFEHLISKFEEFVNSGDALRNCHVLEKQSLSGQHSCHNMHQDHCGYSEKLCFTENGSTCCCHLMRSYNDADVGNHSCSTSSASGMYRTVPQNTPCIVIPLQNLSNESLDHILSLVHQNSSSVNKTSTLPKEEKS